MERSVENKMKIWSEWVEKFKCVLQSWCFCAMKLNYCVYLLTEKLQRMPQKLWMFSFRRRESFGSVGEKAATGWNGAMKNYETSILTTTLISLLGFFAKMFIKFNHRRRLAQLASRQRTQIEWKTFSQHSFFSTSQTTITSSV